VTLIGDAGIWAGQRLTELHCVLDRINHEDAIEGMTALAQKRRPVWRNR
jgi:hypothetical protein